ncbi:amidohydrolase [Microtetraspora sp. NBRC 16547]|uniref:amidohydrolase n=1 Tax=Microtetraspora sp. NBRC 16547 TaxID=3030993 RepID=UPI0024A4CDD3|nr:amidohydrolase [Microtetraspora sp. NBRC 16547]GLW96186.1 peptidase [Microtetraspora sp. NBRC 16547]
MTISSRLAPPDHAVVPQGGDLAGQLTDFLREHGDELIEFRRDVHAHPETAFNEHRTTEKIAQRLSDAGLKPRRLTRGTGLWVDLGRDTGPTVALRADIDALPMDDEKDVPYRSTVPGACHACGHDVHTAAVLGAGLYLAAQADAGALPGRVRLLFQPAEEIGSGALEVMRDGGLSDVDRIFALHCDPRIDVGHVGLRVGAITGSCDNVQIRVSGPGGHTARPHLTVDLVYALSKIITELPAALSRRVDPRSSLSLVWGQVSAGSAFNLIPDVGMAQGSVRSLDEEAWQQAPDLITSLVESVAAAYGVEAEIDYRRGTPPTVNEATSIQMLHDAVVQMIGDAGPVPTPQSLGGEDFSWYVESVPGALARLGTRVPGAVNEVDIHRPEFDVDERAIGVGVKTLAATALTALWGDGAR